MKRAFIFLCVVLCACTMFAQHSVTVSGTASSDAAGNPTLTYNVYRAATVTDCSQPSLLTFSKQNATPLTSTNFVDSSSAVVLSSKFCYYETSFLTQESVPSNIALAVILQPSPPSNVVVVSH